MPLIFQWTSCLKLTHLRMEMQCSFVLPLAQCSATVTKNEHTAGLPIDI